MTDEPQKIALTDSDIERITDAMEKRLLRHFYINVGKGLVSLIWKGLILVLLFLAAYGQFGGPKH